MCFSLRLRLGCFLLGMGLLPGVLSPAFLSALRAAPAPSAPNIIVILVDDMGYSDLGCFGGEIRTPNIDALAENGLRFTQFYNAARCSPTRASLLTGLYPHEAGIGWLTTDWEHPGYRGDLNPSSVTIAQVLKPAGYSAYMSGKWHLTTQLGHWSGQKDRTSQHNWPRQRGFDRFFGILDGTASFYTPTDLVRDNEPIPPPEQPFYLTDGITDNAVGFVEQHTKEKSNSPFFLYLAYNAPHFPNHALPEDIARYDGVYDKGWDELRAERYKRMLKLGIINRQWALTPRDPHVEPWDSVEHKQWHARRMQAYAAQIDRVDQGIGRLVASLRKSDKLSNTVIFFLSDNGGTAEELRADWTNRRPYVPATTPDGKPTRFGNNPDVMPGPAESFQSYGRPWANVSNLPFRRYKKWVHEGGISTPLIVHWPDGLKAQAGSLTPQPGHLVDIMATVVDVSGAAYPEQFQGEKIRPFRGESLLPVMRGGERQRGPIYWEHEGHRAVRDGKWKLVARHGDPWELYDLEADRIETINLAAKEPERVQRMKQLYDAWAARSTVAPWDEVNRVPRDLPVTTEHGYGHVTATLPPKQ